MIRMLIVSAAALLLGGAAPAPEPPPLASPPADAQTWTITAEGRVFGQASRWTAAGGVRWSRDSFSERGYESEIEQQIRFAADGSEQALVVRGRLPSGDAAERFSAEAGRYAFRSPVDHGEGTTATGAVYVPFGGTIDSLFALAEALDRAPGKRLPLLPSGQAVLKPLTTATVTLGGRSRRLTAMSLVGFDLSPLPIWMEDGRVFGLAGAMSYLPQGWEAVAPQLVKAQDEAMAAGAPALLAAIAPRQTRPTAFTHVRLFDAEAGLFRQDMTVVVVKGRIVAVGPAATTPAPRGAQVVDGTGKTLLPGLWDSHKHYGDDASGALLLSQGITTVRDMGSIPEALQARRKRVEANKLLGPRIVPLLMVDGPGPQADHVAVLIATEAEAIAAVRRAKRQGYAGIKIYSSLDPALIPVLAREAKALGLRLQGHLPRGVRPRQAAEWGYDEITHMNFVLMQAMPDAVVDARNGLEQRHYGPARHGAGLDLKAPPMAGWLGEMAARGLAVDPTLVVFERLWATDAGEVAPAYRPFLGRLPPQFERSLLQGGLAPAPDLSRAQLRAGFGTLVALVGELQRRGVPILAGTDGYGLELVRELELYVQAGLTPAQALTAATLAPAKAMGLDAETGSITVGKRAELVLVNGDPSTRIGDLRRVELVMRDGRLMRAADLRAAAGC